MLNTMMKIENNFHQSIQHDEASGYNFYNPIIYFIYFNGILEVILNI